jgi:hypothetical protein
MTNIQEIDFMFEIAFNKNLPDFYDQAIQISNEKILLTSGLEESPKLSNKIYMVYDIPSYLKVKKKDFNTSLGFKSVIQHKGYYIDLNGYNDLETYIKDRFSSSSRTLLRAGKRRLEKCFNISYKMYHGAIDKELYDNLFKRFYDMLKVRAYEKGIENRNLKHWNLYTKKVYDMILKKQASLFVIYDDKKAISISLNMHTKNNVFGFITGYNIDYSKFRIGHTSYMMQLEWFLKNNFKTIDFSKGNTAYKKRWCNKEYDFVYHLFYKKNNILIKMNAIWLLKKLQLKQALRKRDINTYYYKVLGWFQNKKLVKKTNYQLVPQNQLPENKLLIPILFRVEHDFLFLNRIIYSYLYLSQLHVNDLKVYKVLQNDTVFYFQSPKEIIKLILKKAKNIPSAK